MLCCGAVADRVNSFNLEACNPPEEERFSLGSTDALLFACFCICCVGARAESYATHQQPSSSTTTSFNSSLMCH